MIFRHGILLFLGQQLNIRTGNFTTLLPINNDTLTKAKIKRAGNANLKGIATNKLHRRLTMKCSEMPASFYPQPLCSMEASNIQIDT